MRTYVTDTSVLIKYPDILHELSGCRIVIPMAVIVELDRFKSLANAQDPRAKAARAITRTLDSLGNEQDISRGARTPGGSIVMIYRSHANVNGLASRADNKIVGTALKLMKGGKEVVVLSNDANLRNVARAYGITATEYPFPPGSFPPVTSRRPQKGVTVEFGYHNTANPEQVWRGSWQYLLILAAVIIVLAILAIGR